VLSCFHLAATVSTTVRSRAPVPLLPLSVVLFEALRPPAQLIGFFRSAVARLVDSRSVIFLLCGIVPEYADEVLLVFI